METKQPRDSIRSILPWAVAAGVLLFYLLTLNRVLSLSNVQGLARAAGWDWRPNYTGPLYFLLAQLVRLAPAGLQLLTANLISAVCAAATLAMLARSVLLLPHDRTREQRLRVTGEHGLLVQRWRWLPPLAAVLACGLQLGFWEHATTVSGEMVDLLLLAYVIRCLLEYRLDNQIGWLGRMALVYGLGIANNWAMIGYAPALLVALVWICGLDLLQYRVVVRIAVFGLAGLLFYLLLPTVLVITDPGQGDFWTHLKQNLAYQKMMLTAFRPYQVLLFSLASLLPLLLIGIRWPNSMGDISAAGFAATALMTYVIHGAFLALCVYTLFDPPMSARRLAAATGVPMLSFIYIGAICIGYFVGYFLLVFGEPPERSWDRPSVGRKMLDSLIQGAVWVVALGTPVALAYWNLPRITSRNSGELERYAKRLAASLPDGEAVVLSDDPTRLHAVRAVLGSGAGRCIFLDTGAMPHRLYPGYLKRHYASRLPELVGAGPDQGASPAQLTAYLLQAASRYPLYYLHPSFGYYFERFFLEPRALAYELKPLPANQVEIPPLSEALLQRQEEMWRKLDQEELSQLKAKVAKWTPMARSDPTPFWVASYYSRACNHWGVQLMANNKVAMALPAFQRALALNPENPCAKVNLEWATCYRNTGGLLEKFSDEAMAKLQPYAGNWDLLMSLNGPLDEPTFRGELSQRLLSGGLSRQAAQEAQRVLAIMPTNVVASMTLANAYLQAEMPDKALEVVEKMRKTPGLMPRNAVGEVGLTAIEAWAAYLKQDLSKAENILREAQKQHPTLDGPFFALAEIYLDKAARLKSAGNLAESRSLMTNALAVLDSQARVQPTNAAVLANSGGICLQMEDLPRALGYLDRALKLNDKNHAALLNRAIVHLRAGRDEEARRDYEALIKLDSTAYKAYYGLAEIALRNKDYLSASDNFELYLRHAPVNTPEYLSVKKRLEDLPGRSSR